MESVCPQVIHTSQSCVLPITPLNYLSSSGSHLSPPCLLAPSVTKTCGNTANMDRLTADLREPSSLTPVAKTHLRPDRGELGKRLQPSVTFHCVAVPVRLRRSFTLHMMAQNEEMVTTHINAVAVRDVLGDGHFLWKHHFGALHGVANNVLEFIVDKVQGLQTCS